MRGWLRRWRIYLILAPVIVTLGLGFNVYSAFKGNDDEPSEPQDVPKGSTAEYYGLSMQLVGLTKKPPGLTKGIEMPKDAVVVIARFRARIDDPKKAKKPYCESTIENSDGWEWDSTYVSDPYIPLSKASSCSGERTDAKTFKTVKPRPHQWYEFYLAYVVPRTRASELRPTISYYKENPRYLRFSP